MILAELKGYLREHRRAALRDMALRFDVHPDAVRGMLAKWMQKGKVRKLPAGTACDNGCCECDPMAIEIYEWRN